MSRASVAGGPGNDTITVGNGDDKVAGDASLGTPTKNDVLVAHHLDDAEDTVTTCTATPVLTG